MGNVIVTKAQEFREKARHSLEGRWKESGIIFYIYSLLLVLIPGMLSIAFLKYILGSSVYISSGDFDSINGFYTIISLFFTVAGMFISYGFTFYAKEVSLGRSPHKYSVLIGFKSFGKVLLLYLLMYLFIFLWAMLFFIPGIIAFYRYRMAPYILIDNPEKSPLQCIRESRDMMVQNKGRLFAVDISFIGWFLLVIIPFAVVSDERRNLLLGRSGDLDILDIRYFLDMTTVGFFIDFIMVFVVGYVGLSVLKLYFKTTEAHFYLELQGIYVSEKELLEKAKAYDKLTENKSKVEEPVEKKADMHKAVDTKLMPKQNPPKEKPTETKLMPGSDKK